MEANTVTAITPLQTKNVSFTEKVEAVDTALKSRAAAQREIKTKWAAVVKLLQKYDLSVPYRRPDPSTVVGYIRSISLFKAAPVVPQEMKEVLACDGQYELRQLFGQHDLLKLLDKQFSGFGAWADKVLEARRIAGISPELDKEATKAAREEMSAVVDEYLATIEAYDETLESVANVKEYIGIMKEIADISAISQGLKTNN
ncbi:MAG: hypothetical protein KGL39_53125 [Patescibacteria group bacterium]|nr:hypothetical protein [Patescibacteria group bacterium]